MGFDVKACTRKRESMTRRSGKLIGTKVSKVKACIEKRRLINRCPKIQDQGNLLVSNGFEVKTRTEKRRSVNRCPKIKDQENLLVSKCVKCIPRSIGQQIDILRYMYKIRETYWHYRMTLGY